MNPKTLVMNLLILLLVQISNLSVVVNSLEAYHQQYYHRSEFRVPPNSVVRIVISNDLFGLKNNGNAGFVCTNGNGVWRKSKPGDRYVVAQFKYDGKRRQASTHCHLRSRFGFVNFPVNINPDTSAYCYPSYVCGYSVRKDGVYYKPEMKLYPWTRQK
ncbi:hypothetical protein BRARA_F01896 [Brassica rapa]|nr:uncharacterized protein LOC103848059 [Brassica rapa]XP_033128740.1 uncharacterized protein LOC103848059 [Brassica rapa]XP_033128742.1 uncharacterized protein LOC103848059 [Brassica rapa]XP_033128743.1 uncharacterized protein LOC103848059 [Brassica rapa]XP_033128744.1 uncharacterized protein LOC103848059 [Brassica rapa]XP_033128745.1 uncharacterized protein LOC103848059 [Brassica rapa]XP_048590767.1 uncharacterized protein LOC106350269 [Brassica napus]RID58606.1 hypothetical protein BRARA_